MFLYLSTRHYVSASRYPHFTLLLQSLGSLVLAHDAFSLLVPDIFIDTMGYAFALALSKFYFPNVPTAAYVHYPTISTDMLGSLVPTTNAGDSIAKGVASGSAEDRETEDQRGVNAGKGVGWRGWAKRHYWVMFAQLYGWVGADVDVVMANSSWTANHIRNIWGPARERRQARRGVKSLGKGNVEVVFPPVAVEELEREIEVSPESEKKREKMLLYIAQFRPEKNHTLILRAFAKMLEQRPDIKAKLVLVGSVRHSDDATRVYNYRLLTNELHIKQQTEFHTDASWPDILDWLRRSSVGVNGMWNEHFGIGVVEYQAAGLISVVHDSAGPKQDIVIEIEGAPTGTFSLHRTRNLCH
jgi:alpha-1,2-mannosyltransferase